VPTETLSTAQRGMDFEYQAATLDDIRGRPVEDCKPPFHALSRDYFTREAHQHFATEAAAFFLH